MCGGQDRADACGALGSSLPRTPTGRVAVADTAEYCRVATAPVGQARTPFQPSAGPTAWRGDAGAFPALPDSSPVSAASCKMRGPGSHGAPASGAIL
jgi:hypothetical protein